MAAFTRIYVCGCTYRIKIGDDAIGTSMECPNCGLEATFSLQNTVPIDDPSLLGPMAARNAVPIEKAEPATAPIDVASAGSAPSPFDSDEEEEAVAAMIAAESTVVPVSRRPQQHNEAARSPEGCARCGRPFRGEWDRHLTNRGVLCNICANLGIVDETGQEIKPIDRVAAKSPSEHLASIESGANTQGAYANVDKVHDENRQVSSRPWYLDPESREFKLVLLVLALGVVGLTFCSSFFDNAGEVVSSQPAAHLSRLQDQELPTWVLWTGRGLKLAIHFVLILATLWVTLAILNKLPGDSFFQNFFMLLIPGVILMILGLAVKILSLNFYLIVLTHTAHFIIVAWLLSYMFGLGPAGWIMFFVVGIVVQFLMDAVETLLMGLLAHLAGVLA